MLIFLQLKLLYILQIRCRSVGDKLKPAGGSEIAPPPLPAVLVGWDSSILACCASMSDCCSPQEIIHLLGSILLQSGC